MSYQLTTLKAIEGGGTRSTSTGAKSIGYVEPTTLVELIDTLQSIDINTALANINSTTISDNNGGRIEL